MGKTKRYYAKTYISFGNWDDEFESMVDVHVHFTVYPGRSQTLTEPGEPPSISGFDLTLRRDGMVLDCPDWLYDDIVDRDGFAEWLLREAHERDEYDREMKADAERDARIFGRAN